MELGFLEISKFSPEGDRQRRIRCLSGRVSVFRAQDKEELILYRKAIEGILPEDQKFTLLLDGSPFEPKDHFFIGFGGRDQSPPPDPVKKFLQSCGINLSRVTELLQQYHLSHITEDSLCTSLDPRAWRMLRQLSCIEGQASAGLYFLHDPFFEFSEEAKETYADGWADLCWKRKHIVVVTKLSGRPQCWIDNDFIARIPLEKPRQATIGFSGTSDSSQAMVAQLRESESKISRPSIDLTSLSLGQKFKQKSNFSLMHPKTSMFAVIGLIAIFTYVFTINRNDQVAAINEFNTQLQANSINNNDSNLENSGINKQDVHSVNLQDRQVSHNAAEVNSALSSYPDFIKESVNLAVSHPESLFVRTGMGGSSTNYSDSNNENSDLFEVWWQELDKKR